MKLYYAPGACSLSPHIVSPEAGIDLVLERTDIAQKKTESGKAGRPRVQEALKAEGLSQ